MGVAVCGSFGVWELRRVGVAVLGICGVRVLQFVGVEAWGSCSVWGLWCGKVVVWRVAADCSVSKMWCGRDAIGRVAVLVHYGEVAPLRGGVKCMENYWYEAVLVCCSCNVGGLWYGGVTV